MSAYKLILIGNSHLITRTCTSTHAMFIRVIANENLCIAELYTLECIL